MSEPMDALARRAALDAGRSFIVQAPAGSGKTELLIQRCLALLATVDKPEEVIAITFTRKAAAEMRVRIIKALDAAGAAEPSEPHQKTTWRLARAVIDRDETLDWGLTLNPSRLQIMTIDALAHSLVRQMPILSQFGASPAQTEAPDTLYRRAARRVLSSLELDEPSNFALQTVLRHRDNNIPDIEELLIRMLATRDRWLPHVVGDERPELSRSHLEGVLEDCVQQGLAAAAAAVPEDLIAELVAVAAFAASNSGTDSPLRACDDLSALPGTDTSDRAAWMGLRELLLTGSGSVRRRLTASEGFPAASGASDKEQKEFLKTQKQRAMALLDVVAAQPDLLAAVKNLADLPPLRYRDADWQMLDALRTLLPAAAAQLKVVFQEAGVVDFAEVTHRALTALGDDTDPTDLALQLDYRIRHLLIDEFQDTSASQFRLVERLIAGWQEGDGRTLFLVGDPMQSIYRFREADVRLFLLAQEHGVAHVTLAPLQLQSNFRSRPLIVEFCNRVFERIFPARAERIDAAVPFARSIAAKESDEGALVGVHACAGREDEARCVVEKVQDARTRNPDGKIAILVRNRTHLTDLLPALRQAGVRYRAVQIDALSSRPVVQDLWALTRALLNRADRTAWLSILRAPWCALELPDLLVVANHDARATLWDAVIDPAVAAGMQPDAAKRLRRLKVVMAAALGLRGRRDLRRWVEGAWLELGGPACLDSDADMADALAYLDLLDTFEDQSDIHDGPELEAAVARLFAESDPESSDALQIMTIHKAKGLEFDTVILPGLDRSSSGSERPLMQWQEHSGPSGDTQLLIAPIGEQGGEDAIGDFIRSVDKRRDIQESLRLLYVAATRARERLHLIGSFSHDPDGDLRPPASGSLALQLWPALAEDFAASAAPPAEPAPSTEQSPDEPKLLRRLSADWVPPPAPAQAHWRGVDLVLPDADERLVDWAGDAARHVGTAVHRVLQQVAVEGVDRWIGRWSEGLDEYLLRMLSMLGVEESELQASARRADEAIRNTLTDERGRWILTPHSNARAELPLSAWLDGRLYNVVVDRTFIDDEGVRWIIDYKTAQRAGMGEEAFLDEQQQRYRGQLEFYARVMQRFDPTPVRLGLYFPLTQGWRDWRPG